jgi:hypothetical protein
MNAALQTVMVVSGVNATHPATVLAWRSGGTVKVLLGNLEDVYVSAHASQ